MLLPTLPACFFWPAELPEKAQQRCLETVSKHTDVNKNMQFKKKNLTPLVQCFVVAERQLSVKEFLLGEHVQTMLTCLYELLQFRSPLICCPYSCAALVNPTSERCDNAEVARQVRNACQQEFEMVLSMEGDEEASNLLGRLCPQTRWQAYRELLTTMEEADWNATTRVQHLIESWLPRVSASANVEDCFNSMQQAVKKTRGDSLSLPNLQAVHLRASNRNMTGGNMQGRGIELSAHDYEGPEVRGLKSKLFQPTSYTGSDLHECSELLCLLQRRVVLGIVA